MQVLIFVLVGTFAWIVYYMVIGTVWLLYYGAIGIGYALYYGAIGAVRLFDYLLDNVLPRSAYACGSLVARIQNAFTRR